MTSRPRRLPVAVVGVALLALVTVFATVVAIHRAQSAARADQQRLAHHSANTLGRSLASTTDRLIDLGGVAATSASLDEDRFDVLARPLLSNRELAAVSYVLRVPDERRAAYERAHGPIVARRGGPPEPRRSLYYPIDFSVSRYSKPPAGFDEGSSPGRTTALQLAVDRAATQATRPLALASGSGTGILLFTPVYRTGVVPSTVAARRAAAIGFTAGVYRTSDLASEIAAIVPRGTGFAVDVDGTQVTRSRAPLHAPTTHATRIAGHRWDVSVGRPAAGYGTALAIAIVGGLLTVALGLLIYQASRRERYALALVEERMTERDRAEAELREAEHRHRLLADNASDMIVLFAPDGVIRYVSPACHELMGYEPDEMVGRQPREFVHPDDREELIAARERMLQDGGTITVMSRVRRRDGRDVWIEARVRPVLDPETGVAIEGQAIVRDVSERVAADEALRESVERLAAAEQRFRTAFEAAPIGMALAELDGRFIQVNDALCAITGYTRDELESMSFAELSHPSDVAADDEMVRSLLSGEQSTYWMEKRFVDVVGQLVWVAVHATIVRAADGSPQHLLSQIQDVSERVRYQAQLQQMADHDPLTGLLNRRSFERELNQQIVKVQRYGPDGAALVLDIDRFKHINDTLGHNVGDELIVKVAQALRLRLRESDVLARLGGDEFAVLMPHGGAAEARAVAESVLTAIRGQSVLTPAGRRRSVTASVGIALFGDVEGQSAEDVLVNADLAMYDAKEAGRDRAATFSSMERGTSEMRSRITWAERIREALEEDRFTLYAQPIVELSSGEVKQHELLLRMLDEHDNVIGPATFISIAERFDLMQEIDRWVVARAIRHMGEQRRAGRDLVFEVNISGSSTGDPAILDLIERELREHEVDPGNLVLEVTETTAVENIPRAKEFAARLAKLGCRFALDDFGAGFGSFYYLKHLPFDMLKIDGEFVRSCTTSQTDQLLIRAAVDIARGMGKKTIAEYVGDDETLELLRSLGVDFAQGFHIGRPEPLEQRLTSRTLR